MYFQRTSTFVAEAGSVRNFLGDGDGGGRMMTAEKLSKIFSLDAFITLGDEKVDNIEEH